MAKNTQKTADELTDQEWSDIRSACLNTRDDYIKLRLKGYPYEADRVCGIQHAQEALMRAGKNLGIVPPEFIRKEFPKIWGK